MSIETRQAQALRLALLSIAGLVPLGALRAADVRFEPAVEVAYWSDGNVAVVGNTRQSDEILTAGVRLELITETRNSTFTGRYAPYQEFYREFSQFDNLAHTAAIGWNTSFSERSSFSADGSYTRTERQPLRVERPDAAVTFLPRTRQDRGYLLVNGTLGVGRRAFFEWGILGEATRFGDDPQGQFEDSETAGLQGGWGLEISPTSRVGIRVEGKRFTFETSDVADAETLEAFWSKDLGRESMLEVEAGAIRVSSEGETDTGPRAEVRFTRTFQDTSTLEAGVRQDVSADTGITRPTTDSGAYVSWRPGDRAERFEASVTVYYWNREDVFEDGVFHVESFQTAEAFSWFPGRRGFAVGAFHTYYDQRDVVGATPGLETDYHSYGVFVRWEYRKGRGERT